MVPLLCLVLAVVVCIISNEVTAQQCPSSFPNFTDGTATFRDDIHRQLIIPHYAFPCDGLVTRWEAEVAGSLESYDSLVFQVWRFDSNRQTYHLLSSSSNSGDDITVQDRGGVVTMKLESLKSMIDVKRGDVPGVFIGDSRARIKFFEHLNIATYVYQSNDEPWSIIETDDDHYRSAAPLIRAQLKTDDATLGTETGSSPDFTSTQTVTMSPNNVSAQSLLGSPVTHPIKLGTRNEFEDYQRHKLYLTIGIAVATGVIVLMCAFMVIILLVICAKLFQNRNKKCVGNELQSSPKAALSRGYSSENCSLSFLPIDSTSRLNLMAFRRQEATRSMGSAPDIIAQSGGLYHQTNIDDAPDSDMYVEIPPRIHLAKSKAAMGCASASNPNIGAYSDAGTLMKANSSYMVLHSAIPETHMYDEVPCVPSCHRPCEYEIPTSATPSCSSTQPTPIPHAEESLQADKVIYEEI